MRHLLTLILIFALIAPYTAMAVSVTGDVATAISAYEMEESSGTRSDSQASNDLTENGTTIGNGATSCGYSANADLELSNSNYFSIADASQTGLDMSGDFSISLWAKPESLTGDHFLVSKGQFSNSTQQYLLWIQSTGVLTLRISDNGSNTATHKADWNTASASFSAGTCYHIVVTYDASTQTATLYRDGSSITFTKTGTLGSSIYDGAEPFLIGARKNSGAFTSFYDGILNDVFIFGSTLDSTQVTTLYQSGSGLPYNEVTSSNENNLPWATF